MRIIVYPHTLSVGGSQLNAIELAAAVRDRGHEVTVFGEHGPLVGYVRELGLRFVEIPRFRFRPSVAIASALRDLCRRDRIDLVHAYEWPPCIEAFSGPHMRDGVAMTCTVMSMSVPPFLPPSPQLIVGTHEIAEGARSTRSGPVRVLEPPVDTDANHPGIDATGLRTRLDLDGHPTVVIVSRLARELKLEGIARAIAAAEQLAAETGLRLVVVGDGPAREHLEHLAAATNARTGATTVMLAGEVLDPRPAYAVADVVLGMGSSALRAMAFAKPVVVLGEEGFAELLAPETVDRFLWQGFYGLGDGDASAERLAAILRPLLVEPGQRAELGEFARDLVERRFSLRGAAELQEELYREALATRTPRARLWREGVVADGRVVGYKVRRRWQRRSGRGATDDFNGREALERTAALARREGG